MDKSPSGQVRLDQLDGPVLLVEDNAIVAIDTEENLRDLGVKDVVLAYDLDQAETIIGETHLSAAILDFNLPDGNSAKLADQLTEKGIPFIFATGMSGTDDLPERFASHTILVKPFTERDICQALDKLVGLTEAKREDPSRS